MKNLTGEPFTAETKVAIQGIATSDRALPPGMWTAGTDLCLSMRAMRVNAGCNNFKLLVVI